MAYARSQWQYLEQHPSPTLDPPDVDKIVHEVWDEIASLCSLNPVTIHASYNYEKYKHPNYKYVLAMASRTMFLIDGEWQSGALNKYNMTGKIYIDVNPYVPNGWNVDTGQCNIGNHYDLRTVLRHEVLHGIGISSSISPNGVGYSIGDYCYPYAFDNVIETKSGSKVLSGCHLTTELHSDMYVDGLELYNPEPFSLGSSLSHLSDRGILFYGVPARECVGFDSASLRVLNALGGECYDWAGVTSGSSDKSVWGIYICLMLCIKWALRI